MKIVFALFVALGAFSAQAQVRCQSDASCRFDEQCIDGICIHNTTPGPGDGCQSDSDCPLESVCEMGLCVPGFKAWNTSQPQTPSCRLGVADEQHT